MAEHLKGTAVRTLEGVAETPNLDGQGHAIDGGYPRGYLDGHAESPNDPRPAARTAATT